MTPSKTQLEHYMRRAEDFATTPEEIAVAKWARERLEAQQGSSERWERIGAEAANALFRR